MKIFISETSFLHEIATEIENTRFWGETIGRTSFPTLIKEGTLGYDAKFNKKGKPLFIQTKMPEYLSRKDAKEYGYFGKPYFRFDIYPESKSKQHNLLIDLGRKFRNSVFYVGPLFHTEKQFDSIAASRKVITNSKFINTTNLKPNKVDDEHVICYAEKCKSKMWSEETNIEFDFDGIEFRNVLEQIEPISFNQYVAMVRSSIDDFVSPSLRNEKSIFSSLILLGIIPMFIEVDE